MLTSPTIQSDSNAAASPAARTSLGLGAPVGEGRLRPVLEALNQSPQTPRRSMSAASAPPPVLQHRRLASPPSKASHPVLAFAFADTGKASTAQQRRLSTRRQLEPTFARASSLPHPEPSASFLPQEAAAQLLSHKIKSLPDPLETQQALAKEANVGSLAQRTPSSNLATLLQHTTLDTSGDSRGSMIAAASAARSASNLHLFYSGAQHSTSVHRPVEHQIIQC